MRRLLLFAMMLAALGTGCDALGLGEDDGGQALYYVRAEGGAEEVAIAYDEDGETLLDTLRGSLWSHQLEDPSGTLRLNVENLSHDNPDNLIGRAKSFILIDGDVAAVDSTNSNTASVTVQHDL